MLWKKYIQRKNCQFFKFYCNSEHYSILVQMNKQEYLNFKVKNIKTKPPSNIEPLTTGVWGSKAVSCFAYISLYVNRFVCHPLLETKTVSCVWRAVLGGGISISLRSVEEERKRVRERTVKVALGRTLAIIGYSNDWRKE